MPTLLSSGTRKAQRQHRCFFCPEIIQRGERYDFRSFVDDGVFTMKMHPECNQATEHWRQEDYETFSEKLQRGTCKLA